ncbi:F-box/kelch-repeat protein At2g43270-like [Silene latifolia]|uniref:F-box/kelch-repeat protein At2g43270-like n=1 Tax=Silene latifolia TaxID=37657 RepID=UPI003D774FAA
MPAVVESKKQEMESQSKDEKDLIQQTKQRELPHDLISEMILTRLPIKSILRFRSVSKLWYSTLSSSLFAFAHLKFPNPSLTESLLIRNGKRFQIMSYKNGEIDLVNVEVDFDVGDENMDLVGTCNGLVCLGSSSGRLSIIWNPITREFRKYLDLETIQCCSLLMFKESIPNSCLALADGPDCPNNYIVPLLLELSEDIVS